MVIWILHLHMTKGKKQEQLSSVMQPLGAEAEDQKSCHTL